MGLLSRLQHVYEREMFGFVAGELRGLLYLQRLCMECDLAAAITFSNALARHHEG